MMLVFRASRSCPTVGFCLNYSGSKRILIQPSGLKMVKLHLFQGSPHMLGKLKLHLFQGSLHMLASRNVNEPPSLWWMGHLKAGLLSLRKIQLLILVLALVQWPICGLSLLNGHHSSFYMTVHDYTVQTVSLSIFWTKVAVARYSLQNIPEAIQKHDRASSHNSPLHSFIIKNDTFLYTKIKIK
jgi:hypothetical protein